MVKGRGEGRGWLKGGEGGAWMVKGKGGGRFWQDKGPYILSYRRLFLRTINERMHCLNTYE
jgi:hypothetical protein